MHGSCCLASSNKLRTLDAPTPTNISTNAEPDTLINGTSLSPAIARARRVFPHPGTPLKIAPFGTRAPFRLKRMGSFRNSTISSSSCFAPSIPSTSLNFVVTSSSIVNCWVNCASGFPPPAAFPAIMPRIIRYVKNRRTDTDTTSNGFVACEISTVTSAWLSPSTRHKSELS